MNRKRSLIRGTCDVHVAMRPIKQKELTMVLRTHSSCRQDNLRRERASYKSCGLGAEFPSRS
jgi:hypothetical protein